MDNYFLQRTIETFSLRVTCLLVAFSAAFLWPSRRMWLFCGSCFGHILHVIALEKPSTRSFPVNKESVKLFTCRNRSACLAGSDALQASHCFFFFFFFLWLVFLWLVPAGKCHPSQETQEEKQPEENPPPKKSSEQVLLNNFCWVPDSRRGEAERSSCELLKKHSCKRGVLFWYVRIWGGRLGLYSRRTDAVRSWFGHFLVAGTEVGGLCDICAARVCAHVRHTDDTHAFSRTTFVCCCMQLKAHCVIHRGL